MASQDRMLHSQPSPRKNQGTVRGKLLHPLRLVTSHGGSIGLAAPPVRRKPLDQALKIAEYGVGILTIIFWLVWFANGWGYDWIHPYLPHATTPPATSSTSIPVADFGSMLPGENSQEQAYNAQPEVHPANAIVGTGVVTSTTAFTATPPDLRPVRIEAPSIGLDSPIKEVFLEGDQWQVAEYATGYLHGTGLPGSGNTVLAGHKGVRGSVFRNLEQLQLGDDIWIEAGGQRFHYRVSATGRVWPEQIDVMYPTEHPTLTLITCTDWDLQRFIVAADLIPSQK